MMTLASSNHTLSLPNIPRVTDRSTSQWAISSGACSVSQAGFLLVACDPVLHTVEPVVGIVPAVFELPVVDSTEDALSYDDRDI